MTRFPGVSSQPPPRPVVVHVSRAGPLMTVVLCGDLDGITAPAVVEVIETLAVSPVRQVVLEATDVGFLDLAGLRTLLRAHRLSARRGVRLTLHHPAPHIRWLLTFTDTAALLLDHESSTTADDAPNRRA
ncbi:STAS domain-containing protein [Jidongwangia harbinensis]|uniref:STAS domain-containing protein n=1 Tax=Jidongwangia harbinensis TaxID=2878561 RepID=UPI001CD96F25|nr:STAS domain-containing protein [Jidongwangia harbinensis]MCA2218654.1 STAS domain-containing protein [Jidongwangia harbinensis]